MKKAMFLFIGAFLIIAGCSKSDDFPVSQDETQLKSATIGKDMGVQHWEGMVSDWVTNPKTFNTCDGKITFSGKLDGHCTMFGHYTSDPDPSNPVKNFVWEWMNMRISGIVTNVATNEEFKIDKVDRWNKNQDIYTVRYNLIGNMGSHYILFGTGVLGLNGFPTSWDYDDKVVCPGNN